MSLFHLSIAWVVYLTLHSLLVSEEGKSIFYKMGFSKQIYRLFYSIFATISLFVVLIMMGTSDKSPILNLSDSASNYLGLSLATFGILVARTAFQNQSLSIFLGFKKEKTESSTLITDGIYSKIRHPLYSGMILILIGLLIYTNTKAVLVSVVCIFLYLPIGIHLEEKKLIKEFGEQYIRYRQNVKAVIPYLL